MVRARLLRATAVVEAVQNCRVSTVAVVTRRVQFDCTVQLVIGLGSTHLP